MPVYKLAQVEIRPITPPKFVRDQMNINDIDGARPKKHKVIEYETREIMLIEDIEGTKAKERHKKRNRSPDYNAYDYSDITKSNFVSRRSVNPLSPVYVARD